MTSVYLLCAVTGSAFVVLTQLLGHAVGGGDHGGHGGDHGGTGDDGGVHLPWFSPMALAAYLTGFGCSGLLLTGGLGLESPLLHVPLAVGSAGLFGTGLLYGMWRIRHHAEGNSLARPHEVVGQLAEVTVSIPDGGLGEVAFVAGGTRLTASARTKGTAALVQGMHVRVVDSVDGTLTVEAAPSLPPASR